MENIDFATLFQGIGTMMASGWVLASARVFLVLLGLLLIYLGWKGILEPMVMIPMGLGTVHWVISFSIRCFQIQIN